MRYLKYALALLATIAGAVATAMTNGAFHVSPQTSSAILAVAGFVGFLGFVPIPIGPFVGRLLSSLAVVLSTFQGIHAASVTAKENPHPWLWASVGVAAILLGIIGRSPIPHADPVAPPVA